MTAQQVSVLPVELSRSRWIVTCTHSELSWDQSAEEVNFNHDRVPQFVGSKASRFNTCCMAMKESIQRYWIQNKEILGGEY